MTSTIFVVLARLITGSVGLVICSGGEIVDDFGFGRFRLARFVGKGGDVVVTIISGGGIGTSFIGEDFFSLRADRFFFVCVVDVT